MAFLKKFIKLMKHELLAKKPKKTRFAWTLSDKKYLKLSDVNKLKRACGKVRHLALRHDSSVAVRDWFMIELGLNTGLRVEEMRELKCGDLNIQKGQASISVRKGKGDKPRNVKISESFKNRCKRFLEWKKKRGQSIEPDSRLLTSNKGTQLSKRNITQFTH